MLIREATLNDKTQLLSLLNEFDEYFTKNTLFSKDILPFAKYKDSNTTFGEVANEWLTNPAFYLLVAEEGNKLAGYICGTIKNLRVRVLDKEGSIEDWFVKEEYRRQGVGKQLYDRLVETFIRQRCSHLALRVYTGNQQIIRLYENMGYSNIETRMVKQLSTVADHPIGGVG